MGIRNDRIMYLSHHNGIKVKRQSHKMVKSPLELYSQLRLCCVEENIYNSKMKKSQVCNINTQSFVFN